MKAAIFLQTPMSLVPSDSRFFLHFQKLGGKTFPGDVLKFSQRSQLQNQLAPNPPVTSGERWGGGLAAALTSTQTGLLLLFLGKKEKERRKEEGGEGGGGREKTGHRAKTHLDGVWVQTPALSLAGAGVPETPFSCNKRLSPQR